MSISRSAVVLLATLALAPSASAEPRVEAASAGLKAPSSLRAFLLRADEPITHSFPRTPSFAWAPVRGANGYEFELSTNRSFSDSAIVWTNDKLKTPAVSVPVALPWMTGAPHALYARVRARSRRGLSNWSTPFGFDMRWPTVPYTLPGSQGLVRWTPIEGASAYHVWYVNAGKLFTTKTNVADQRDFYTFHQDQSWTGVVRWRVRAVRSMYGAPANSLPAVSYGPWSPIFTTYNTPFASGPLTNTGNASDVSTGSTPAAFRLMPSFSFVGNQSLWGSSHELYRVYVSTDRDCVNTVYRGAIVGGPAYAPRISGPLALPQRPVDLAAARSSILKDGKSEGRTFGPDGFPIVTNESLPSETGTGTGTGDPASGTGAPMLVDLWDSGWPERRYYWTVVSVIVVAAADDPEKLEYYDIEVPQDTCAAGRVFEFGKTSQPALTGSTSPYVSGMGTGGRYLSARRAKPVFYGAPLVAWEPALGADLYEVQWSNKRYPWKSVGMQTTPATSALLPLTPGTWHYRVRGLSSALPQTGRQMTWSQPVTLVVAKPRFVVVG